MCVCVVPPLICHVVCNERPRVEADRQLCFANRPSGNKHYANHSPNESITLGPIRRENKCLHLTQHGGSSAGKMQFLNTQAKQRSLVFLTRERQFPAIVSEKGEALQPLRKEHKLLRYLFFFFPCE